ncbi:MAG TPA: hypothetical protein VFN72_09470, partial [Solirubrobacterales bacterium]|nr:hypothetical protein [Solirubrobacterales bacterium]
PVVVVGGAAVVVGIGEVGDGIETCVVAGAATVVSPLESEPQPGNAAMTAAAPSSIGSERPTRIGPAG